MTIGRFVPLPLVWRRLTVLRTSEPTPRMRRVTLGGPEAGAFARDGLDLPAFTSLAFDDHVKVVLAPGGDLESALPVQRANGIEWPASATRVTRDYTPVHVDAEAGELSLDFVVHTPEGAGGAGPAEEWAAAARPGDELVIVGPKSSSIVPGDAQWAFLIGDETGLPAIERFLTERPVTGPVTVVVHATAHEALPELPLRQHDSLITVVSEAGDPKALVNAMRETVRPDGPGYVWAGAESRSLLAVRRLVTREWGVPKDRQNITGYWHRVDARPAEPASPGAPARPAAGQLLPVLPQVVHSPVSWFAVRIALRSGLLGRCESAPAAIGTLAAELQIPRTRLEPLVRLLTAAEVLAMNDDGTVSVGPGGELILGDEHVAELFDGWWADQVMTLTDLDERLGDDEPNWRQRRGDSYYAYLTADAERYRELMETAERLTFLLPAIRTVPALADGGPLVTVGPGAAIVGGALAADGRAVRIVEDTVPREALAAALGESPVELSGTFDEPRPVVAALALDARDEHEAGEYLAGLAAVSSSLVLIEATGTDALGPRAGDQALVRVGVNGAGPRTRDDLESLAVRSGWQLTDATPLGWGVEALTLEAAPAR